MSLFSANTFKRKLYLLISLTTGLGLFIAVMIFVIHDYVTVKNNLESRITTQAKVVAENTVTALLFDDQQTSEELLSSLQNDSSIITAAIYSSDGILFAQYRTDSGIKLPTQVTESSRLVDYKSEIII
jgi:uncharacterized membrane protein affecting hemolysin expression